MKFGKLKLIDLKLPYCLIYANLAKKNQFLFPLHISSKFMKI